MSESGIKRVSNILREIEFFEEFNSEEILAFARFMSLRTVPGNTILFNQGDIGDFIMFIVEGSVQVRLESESSSSKQVIASYGWGACVGEMSIIDDYPRSATVIVTEPSELLIITKSRFEKVVEENPVLGVKMLKGLAKNLSMRLRGATGRFMDLA